MQHACDPYCDYEPSNMPCEDQEQLATRMLPGTAALLLVSLFAAGQALATQAGTGINGVPPAVTAHYTPSSAEVGWQTWVGFAAGVIPFVIGAYEFGKRIIIQQRCKTCGGNGLVRGTSGRQVKCPTCGGFFPWVSWKLFLTSTAAPGNGGPLRAPKGQTSIFYKVPSEPSSDEGRSTPQAGGAASSDPTSSSTVGPSAPMQTMAGVPPPANSVTECDALQRSSGSSEAAVPASGSGSSRGSGRGGNGTGATTSSLSCSLVSSRLRAPCGYLLSGRGLPNLAAAPARSQLLSQQPSPWVRGHSCCCAATPARALPQGGAPAPATTPADVPGALTDLDVSAPGPASVLRPAHVEAVRRGAAPSPLQDAPSSPDMVVLAPSLVNSRSSQSSNASTLPNAVPAAAAGAASGAAAAVAAQLQERGVVRQSSGGSGGSSLASSVEPDQTAGAAITDDVAEDFVMQSGQVSIAESAAGISQGGSPSGSSTSGDGGMGSSGSGQPAAGWLNLSWLFGGDGEAAGAGAEAEGSTGVTVEGGDEEAGAGKADDGEHAGDGDGDDDGDEGDLSVGQDTSSSTETSESGLFGGGGGLFGWGGCDDGGGGGDGGGDGGSDCGGGD